MIIYAFTNGATLYVQVVLKNFKFYVVVCKNGVVRHTKQECKANIRSNDSNNVFLYIYMIKIFICLIWEHVITHQCALVSILAITMYILKFWVLQGRMSMLMSQKQSMVWALSIRHWISKTLQITIALFYDIIYAFILEAMTTTMFLKS